MLNKPLTGVDLEIIEFIQSWFSDLRIVNLEDYKYSILLFKDNKFFLCYHKHENYLMIRFDEFWEVLNSKYFFEDSDIKKLLKVLIIDFLKIQIDNIKDSIVIYTSPLLIEDDYLQQKEKQK
jgi:hypothetical protein